MRTTEQKLPRRIYLIGFSGSGKSTVGPILAKKLKARFVDTDSLIEKEAKRTIAEIFSKSGESLFRRLEARTIKRLLSVRGRWVISLGGGAFASPANRKVLAGSGPVIFLSCSAAELYRRIKDKTDRPLVGGLRSEKLARIKSLLDRRLKSYQLADLRVSTTKRRPAETVRAIVKILKERYGNN